MIPSEIEAEMLRLARLMEHHTKEMAKRAQNAAECDAAYKAARAKCFLKASGSVAVRDAQADVECEVLYRDRKIAEALMTSAVEAGRNYRLQVEMLRSLLAQQRFELANASGTGG